MTLITVDPLFDALAAEAIRLHREKVALEAENARLRGAIRKALEVLYPPGSVYRLLSEALKPGEPPPPELGAGIDPQSYAFLDDGYTVVPSYELIHDDHPGNDSQS